VGNWGTVKEWLRVLKAADAAARWHVHQRRKGPAKEPYINHLLEVATLVADATDGADTNLVIAALLHDAIEDCEVPRELIAEIFRRGNRRQNSAQGREERRANQNRPD
jgi:GTP diphosphokinase / guanosine-3',5'-bis(diphosphate) 3'-diphosphatase